MSSDADTHGGRAAGHDFDLSVIIFAFNEAENIPPVLAELQDWLDHHLPRTQIVFVDDGSTDDTSGVVRRSLRGPGHVVLRHEKNRGIGAALKTGVRASHAPRVTFLPADGQVPPSALGTLMDRARAEDADVVLSVYDHRDDGLDRTLLSWGVRTLILAVHGVRLASDGPYLFRRALFDPDQLVPDTFFLNFEFPIRVLAAGLRVSTVTVPCRKRIAGHSKSTGWKRVAGVGRDLLDLRVRRTRDAVERALGRALR